MGWIFKPKDVQPFYLVSHKISYCYLNFVCATIDIPSRNGLPFILKEGGK